MSTTFRFGFVGVSTQTRACGRPHRRGVGGEVGLVDEVVLEAEAREHLGHEAVRPP
jgi:hypothetical protein